MNQFDIKEFAKNEIELGKALLEKFPDDMRQWDRVSYWYMRLGDLESAKKYAKSSKMKYLTQ